MAVSHLRFWQFGPQTCYSGYKCLLIFLLLYKQESSRKVTMASSLVVSLIFLSSLVLASQISVTRAQLEPPLVTRYTFNISYTFYSTSCPSLETTIRDYLTEIFNSDFRVAAGILRVHFHDCFVQGCDGSLLLDGSEQQAPPNLALQSRAFVLIDELRTRVHRACGAIVSCSDITALSAREAVFLSGGPNYRVPLGRRDGLTFATIDATLANLPSFRSGAAQLTAEFANKSLDVTDLVALSGGHTIGRATCPTFVGRLYPTRDPTLETSFANNLTQVCPTDTSTGIQVQDIRTPNVFDNAYYTNLVNRQGLFTSDQDLFTDTNTSPIVQSFANNQTLFFERFGFSMIRMGMMGVLTGTQGQIRTNCSRINPTSAFLETTVDEQGRSAAY
ncbi:peroxidase [Ranunculus cassubicifolius]